MKSGDNSFFVGSNPSEGLQVFGGIPSNKTSTKQEQQGDTEAGDNLSNRRAVAESPVPVEFMRRKTF
jgi:hypothetical protein